ncbi:metal ABC transporter solute-binding protein, Zn/Mn family [Candidatus Uabimicrobium amorphum]|uniref:ABC transporter substrate-binding protein n=1 Tax=Uabimicrobium amorphum TaxID=2596890 RepID=A0A5S9IQH5_UABAM|nr:zinc ABC transporter substrate-binding protein [Candidatus Uabimicrobium amorphum]BBM84825.1 ABC transporter substrate-binding protein [Candidatus Uabimicrobium amorphum]
MMRLQVLLIIFVSIALGACRNSTDTDSSKKAVCFVSILPQSYFVKRIGGEFVDVKVLVGPGQSPATYEPTQKQLAVLSKALCLFTIGVPFEKSFVSRISRMYKIKLVETHAGIKLRDLEEHSHHHHDHHHNHGKDPHVWLDPILVKKQTQVITDTLSQLLPAHKEYFAKNLQVFHDELSLLDEKIRTLLQNISQKNMWVYHPSYGYFCDRYHLKQIAVETEGKSPGAKHLAKLISKAKTQKIRAIFVQKQFMGKSPNAIISALEKHYKSQQQPLSCKTITLDPLAYDYTENLLSMAKNIAEYLK